MLRVRVIPVLFLMNGLIVRSETFNSFLAIGNPINQLERLSQWEADELIYVDITREGNYDLKRDDHKIKRRENLVEIIQDIARASFMPLTFGGRIRSLEDVDIRIANGADKVVINSAAYRNPQLITQVAQKYGSQCMVVGIDVKKEGSDYVIYIDQGRSPVKDDLVVWAQRVESLGAGEIFLNSIDRDGTRAGYDLEIIQKVTDAVTIPVIACGGVGSWGDFAQAIEKTNVSAVAAGNIFHFTEHAYPRAKKYLRERGLPVR